MNFYSSYIYHVPNSTFCVCLHAYAKSLARLSDSGDSDTAPSTKDSSFIGIEPRQDQGVFELPPLEPLKELKLEDPSLTTGLFEIVLSRLPV